MTTQTIDVPNGKLVIIFIPENQPQPITEAVTEKLIKAVKETELKLS